MRGCRPAGAGGAGKVRGEGGQACRGRGACQVRGEGVQAGREGQEVQAREEGGNRWEV